MDMLQALSLAKPSSGSAAEDKAKPAASSASRALLEERRTQRLEAESEAPAYLAPVAKLMSDYHRQIAESSVDEPRRQSRKGKHNRKVEKGQNYQSKLSSKHKSKTDHRELVRRLKSK